MNCLSAVNKHYAWSPYYDDDKIPLNAESDLQRYLRCKVYSDGTHKVAVPVTKLASEREISPYTVKDLEFDELYLQSVKEDVREPQRVAWITDKLEEHYEDDLDLKAWVEEKCNAKIHNAYARRKRFRRKAYLNPWNYFVTFTYSDALHDEESFKIKLRKCLSNLHTRRGWKFMGVPEYSPETHRLHYHLLVYVPEGQMIGSLREVRDYSMKHKRMQVRHVNSFFEETFGRNDFEPLDNNNFSLNRTIDYILKYMEKDGERVIYSRGIPTELETDIGTQEIAAEFVDYVYKMVLFDDIIDDGADILHKNSTYVFDKPLKNFRE